MNIQDRKFEVWKNGLLDVSRRNKLMNYRKSRRATLQIVSPGMSELYRRLMGEGPGLIFRKNRFIEPDPTIDRIQHLFGQMGHPIEIAEGEVRSDLELDDMAVTLANLRSKALLAREEQGINILYACFGFLKWRQKPSEDWMLSPLVLVPVSVEKKTILGPYHLKRMEEDIVVNPTLEFVLETEQHIKLPEFDPAGQELDAFLGQVEEAVAQTDWTVQREASLGLLSFLKIVMYKDLEKNRERIFENPVIKAFCGDGSGLPEIEEEWEDYDHDQDPAAETAQVVGADASQKDAILLSRKGVSFVLQGPPGTGKSQTITNIIAQAMADGKKVLFVSQKMAALSVVYRRLEEAGLADYCLSLHDYKAEKKAVLGELVRTLDAPKKSLKTGAETVFPRLENEKEILNNYGREMTQKRQPLDMSLFTSMHQLVGLEEEAFYSSQEETQEIDTLEYETRLQILGRYVQFMQQHEGKIEDNPWRGTSLTRQDPRTGRILFSGAPVAGLCKELEYMAARADRLQGILDKKDLASYGAFEELCRQIGREEACRVAREKGRSIYGDSLLTEEHYAWLRQEYNDFCRSYRVGLLALKEEGQTRKRPSSLRELLQEKDRVQEQLDALLACGEFIREAARSMGALLPVNADSLTQIQAAAQMLMTPADFKTSWFASHLTRGELSAAVRKLKTHSDQALKIKEKIDEDWGSQFYFTEEAELLNRFRNDYDSIFSKLSRAYREDKKQLSASWRGGRKMADADCIRGLENLQEYKQSSIEFYMALKGMPAELELQNETIETDWEGMLKALDACSAAEVYIRNYGISQELERICRLPRDKRTGALIGQNSAEQLYRYGQVDRVRETLEKLGTGSYEKDCANYADRINHLDTAIGRYQEIADHLRQNGQESQWEKLADFGQALETYLHFYESLQRAESRTQDYFAREGIRTDDADRMAEMKQILSPYLKREADQIRSLAATAQGTEGAEKIVIYLDQLMKQEDCLRETVDGMAEFAGWFPGKDFTKMSLKDYYRCADRCRDTESLGSWLAYAQLEKECRDHALTDFLAFGSESGISYDHYIPAYQKAFLTKWTVDTIARYELYELYQFNAKAHEHTIEEFKTDSDIAQNVIRARLTEQLSGQKPSGLRQMAGAMDEISILRKEAGKKSRIMPLRRLFKTIPGLLRRLKPCFMMSPLSVAYFLDSDRYDFDMVIFDEASQILPEDAIGAIYRADQAIIAGDSKQLPPTTFFSSAGRNLTDYEPGDEEEDYYPDVVSDSLLDEAASLPQCTLLWHYRSRDESLIAFSNRHLYENRLTTFPGCAAKADKGLEYILVPDGVYEGGGKNRNIKEAEKCVELLEDHIKRHPGRSLGIVAFSERQQAEIESAVNRFRMQHLEYESFFDEAKEEPFFVKNLENVQGDERDTIFFSICYAKNAQGRMYQRFGPLSAAGGERRLNVAITRAKYNVKLIGSIEPSDIIVKEDTGAGVRLLQEYIRCAMQSSAHIPEGTDQIQTGEAFADDVAAYIAELGYQLRRDIGQSDCKIDIGIVNPANEAEYIAGIECDGSHYDSTRTAYDRDVLRKSVMKGMGWKLHHVWALSWFMKPEEEKARLQAFLEEAMAAAAADTEDMPEATETEAVKTEDDYMTETETSEEVVRLQFTPYRQADPLAARFPAGCSPEEKLCARIALVLSEEQPIHKKELLRRMCPAFGEERVTQTVKTAIDHCLTQKMQGEVERKGDFLYLTGTTSFIPRGPAEGAEPREIDLIAPEEICAGMETVLCFSYGLGKEDLLRETARQFGYAQLGQKIRGRLEEAFDILQEQEIIRQSDDRIYLKEEES